MTEGTRPALLIVEDDQGLAAQLKWAMADSHAVTVVGNRPAAVDAARRQPPKAVILDLGLPPDPNGASEGLACLEELLALDRATKVIVSSGNEERGNALQAVRLGAYDFYPKPVDVEVLRLIVGRAVHLRALEDENRALSAAGPPAGPLAGVIAESPAMIEICRVIERVGPTSVGVLLIGESGTGKEVLARALHDCSDRASGPFVAINCAAIPETLLESELFGHEKGAFTGAVKQTVGKVEQADGGTLFLDEIGDMPLQLQAKMLRFLQERVIERVGGSKTIHVDVRVVSATNRDLSEMIAAGTFREDLFYRLDEVGLRIPPLRERHGDAVLLARHFLNRFARALDRPIKGYSADALAAISSYEWPGNVRELENRVKRALVLAQGGAVTAADLKLEAGRFPTLRESREQSDLQAVTQALALADNNVSAAAKLLGVSRPTLYDLMKNLNLKVG